MGDYTGVFLFVFGVPALLVLIAAFRRSPASSMRETYRRHDRRN